MKHLKMSYLVLAIALPVCAVYGLLLNIYYLVSYFILSRKLSHIPKAKFPHYCLFITEDYVFRMMKEDFCKYEQVPPVANAGYFLQGNPVLLINGLHEIQEAGRLPRFGPAYETIPIVLGQNVLTATDWESRRAALDPSFHIPNLAKLAKYITAEANQLVKTIHMKSDQPIFINDLAGTSVLKILVDSFCGGLLPADKIYSLFHEAHKTYFLHAVCTNLVGMTLGACLPWPWLQKLQKFNEIVDGELEKLVHAAQEEFPKNPENIMTALLDSMSIEEAKGEVQGLLTGASVVIPQLKWCLYYLAFYPEEANKLQLEVDTVLGNATPTNSDIPKLRYCKAFVFEVLRMRPSSPQSYRVAVEDCSIGGYNIPKGTPLLLNLGAPMLHQQYVDDPFTFRPQRFLDEHTKHVPITSFSVGQRGCMGQNFAKMIIPILLAAVVQNFTVTLPPKFNTYIPAKFTGTWEIDELYCIFTARTKQ